MRAGPDHGNPRRTPPPTQVSRGRRTPRGAGPRPRWRGARPRAPPSRTSSRIASDLRRAPQPLGELVADQRPGEVELLLGPLVGQPLLPQLLPVREDPLPRRRRRRRRAGRSRSAPGAPSRPAVHQAQRPGQLPGRGPGLRSRSPSALFTAITSASSRMPFLMPWSWSPVRARVSKQEGVDHAGHGDLGLAHADRLDQHHVVAGGLEHRHRLAWSPGRRRRGCRRSATAGCRRPGRPAAAPSGSCRRGPSRRCGRRTGRRRARRPGGPRRSAGCRAPR